jgi:hypothetical protein
MRTRVAREEPGHGLQRGRLTQRRHGHQPPQVLPLDEANRVDLVRIRHPGSGLVGHGGIHDRCEWIRMQMRIVEKEAGANGVIGQVGDARQAEGRFDF